MTLDPNTALKTGYLIGHLIKAGIEVEPVLEHGNYTNELHIRVPSPVNPKTTTTIKVRVLTA